LGKSVRPYLKNNLSKKGLECDLSVSAWLVSARPSVQAPVQASAKKEEEKEEVAAPELPGWLRVLHCVEVTMAARAALI
jgi:hypothetical protein